MDQRFSEETLELFERAERAIQQSGELRELIAIQLERASRDLLEFQARRFSIRESSRG